MLGRAGTRGWTAALCLLALLPSRGAEINPTMPVANGSSLLEASPTVLVPELKSRPTTLSPTSTPGSTSLQPAVEDSKGTTAALPEPAANITAATMTTSTPGNGTTFPAGTPATTTLSPTTHESAAPETSPTSSTAPTDTMVPSENSTSPETPSLETPTSPSPATNIIQFTLGFHPSCCTGSCVALDWSSWMGTGALKLPTVLLGGRGEIKCSSVKEVRVSQSICLRLNQTSSCVPFLIPQAKNPIESFCSILMVLYTCEACQECQQCHTSSTLGGTLAKHGKCFLLTSGAKPSPWTLPPAMAAVPPVGSGGAGYSLDLWPALGSGEDFLRDNGEALARVLCAGEPEAGPCSWRLAQSEVAPHCLLLLMANLTELSSKLQFLRQHQSELRKLGIHELSEEDVARHQSYSRKTLIALVTAGLLLAVLGIAGYFLMNRRSWSPAGERLGEDPYFSENGGGPRASPERQPKAATSHGAQENGRAAPRNGHSAPHAVADTEL
ncbi:hematopoietic progenitor cell antigen CD34 [Suncus etruscus]|uniref:hematopoietic progenitor cell antigen CD34 n=1 Tax=Suncus etruscus TaxID=109475 RepID=UPI00210F3895|nr:hematopoietic progenitor cell antigen CD34 [Suncus etruscus]